MGHSCPTEQMMKLIISDLSTHTLQAVTIAPGGWETAPIEHVSRLYNYIHTLRFEPWWMCASFFCEFSVVDFGPLCIPLLMSP